MTQEQQQKLKAETLLEIFTLLHNKIIKTTNLDEMNVLEELQRKIINPQ